MLMAVSPRMLSIFAGSIWLLAGANLLLLGSGFLLQSADAAHFSTGDLPLLHATMEWLPEQEFAMPLLACIATAIGFLKGQTVMRKAACREVQRIIALPRPVSVFQLYSLRGAILLVIMFCLGFSLRFFRCHLMCEALWMLRLAWRSSWGVCSTCG